MLTSGIAWDLLRGMFDDVYHDQRDEKWVGREHKECREHCSAVASQKAEQVDTTCVCEDKQELKRHVDERQDRERDGMPESMSSSTTSAESSTSSRFFAESVWAHKRLTFMVGSVESPVSSLDTPGQTTSTGEDYASQTTSSPSTGIGADDPFATTTAVTSNQVAASATTSAATSLASLSNKGTSSGGLSQSSKIGLGVGLGVGLSLLIAAIVFFCLVRRRKRKTKAMGSAKYTPHGQSDLSMIEQSQPIQMKAEQSRPAERQPLHSQAEYHEQQPDLRHSQAYYEIPPPPAGVFQAREEQSPVTPIEPEIRGRDAGGIPLALAIPGHERKSGVSRDPSPVRSQSPVSPVSPVSAVSPVNSRPPSPTA